MNLIYRECRAFLIFHFCLPTGFHLKVCYTNSFSLYISPFIYGL